ncbi:TetR/AcrR family transcriptional regulator [Rhodococcus sp. SORGH_AS_0301]|uniref:TetR/AcrR family transcriptional regulator n=1 Tax=Rhodococcus sp. SORGH_AS_0301 TaxID=3041780 RepID=UPI0027D82B19|nr:TetR family transcriptional regulator [Rhodococcus sp. SORGH_AS_0301]
MIIDGAFALARRDGLDALSMPNLARHLGVGVTSIYWYYKNKDDLLRQMHAAAVRSIHEKLPSVRDYEPEDWRDYLHTLFRRQREVYSEDSLVTDLMLSHNSDYSRRTTHFVYAQVEHLLAFLVRAGFDLDTAWHIHSALSMLTRGFTVTERARTVSGTPPVGPEQLRLLNPDDTPLLARLAASGSIIIDTTGDTSFEFGLEMILDDAERRLAATNTPN